MHFVMNWLSRLIGLFPMWIFGVVAVAMISFIPAPGVYFTETEWPEFLFLISPLATWFLIALADGIELFELDAKGGRVNFGIAWILLIISFFDGGAMISEGSRAVPPMIVIMLVLTAIMVIRWRTSPGAFRESLDREINLIRFGTTWRPAKTLDHGSAELGDVNAAAPHFEDGDIIFGTANKHLPEAENMTARVLRVFIRTPIAISTFFKRLFSKKGKGNRLAEAWQAAKLAKGSKTTPPLLKGDFNGHLLVVSGSGGGKTVSFVIPNALHYNAGSMVAIDPKGEVHAVTARARKEYGHSVYKIAPGSADTDTFNCIGWLDAESPSYITDCQMVASWFFQSSEGGSGDGAAFFADSAKRLFSMALAHHMAEWNNHRKEREKKGKGPDPKPDLSKIYEYLSMPGNQLYDKIGNIHKMLVKSGNREMYGKSTGAIAQWAASFMDIDKERTWPNIVSSVQKELYWLGDPSLSAPTKGWINEGGTGKVFDSREIIDGKTSIYMCVPLDILNSTPGFARLVMGAIMNSIIKADPYKKKGSTLFLVDEMQTLGRFDLLHKDGLNQGRGYGMTLAGIIQTPDALNNSAGEKTYESWVDNTVLQQFFAIGSEETAEKISRQIGETTVETRAYSGGAGKTRGQVLGADQNSISITKQRHSRRLKTASEVMNLDRTYAVVFRRMGVNDSRVGKKPMIVGSAFYKAQPELMKLADDNPFDRDGPTPDLIVKAPIQPPVETPETTHPPQEEEERDAGDWEDVSPYQLMSEAAVDNPEMQKYIDAVRKAENGEELGEEDRNIIQARNSIPTRAREVYDDTLLDDLDPAVAEMDTADKSRAQKAEEMLKKESERLEKQKESAIASGVVRTRVSDLDESSKRTIKTLISTIGGIKKDANENASVIEKMETGKGSENE